MQTLLNNTPFDTIFKFNSISDSTQEGPPLQLVLRLLFVPYIVALFSCLDCLHRKYTI
jgi:hypothetical protein